MRKFLLVAAALGAIAGTTAVAQNASSKSPGNGTPAVDDEANSSATRAGAVAANPSPAAPANVDQAAKQAPTFARVRNTDMLSSNVVGLDVYNSRNDKIGKVQDIAFDSSKQVTGYVLSIGGFLGIRARYVAVDPSSLTVSYDASNKVWRATMNGTEDQLKSAPEFKYSGPWTASRS
jgi:sporulation protein YlmC with PRC-barrel domain